MKPVAVIIAAVLAALSTACVTTTTGAGEKWDKAERADLHTRMGVSYLQQGQVEVAREEFELALRIEPDNAAANLAMARLQLQLNQERKARSYFARSVRSDPNGVAARNEYGLFLCNQGEFADGLEQLTAALNNPLNRSQYISLFAAAECQRKAGNADDAAQLYQQALDIEPDLRPALLQLAFYNFDRGEHMSARAFLERYFGDGNYTAESLFLAVRNELSLERRDLAENYARLLRTRFPDSERIGELRGLFGNRSG